MLTSLFLCGRAAAQAPAGGAEPTFTFVEMAPGVWAALVVADPPSYAFANSLVVDLGGGLLVVDTQQSPAAAEALIAEIRARGSGPVRWVVNTHWHGDHVYGNVAYRRTWPEVVFIGHHTLREDLLELGAAQLRQDRADLPASVEERRRWLADGRGPQGEPLTADQRRRLERSIELRLRQIDELEALELVPPDLAFDRDLTLSGARRAVQLLALGPAHTRGDVVVWLPAEGILAGGDLVEDAYPWVEDADIRGWARALERMSELGPSTLLPAHGAPWQGPARRLELQDALFRAAVAAACAESADGQEAPPELDAFRAELDLPGGEPRERFWASLLEAARDSVRCDLPGARGEVGRQALP